LAKLDYFGRFFGRFRSSPSEPSTSAGLLKPNHDLTRSILGFNLSFLFDRSELLHEAMDQLLRWVEEGKIQPLAVHTYPFEKVAQAHRDLESGQTVGKLVLIP